MTERLRLSSRLEQEAFVVEVGGEVDMDSSPRMLAEIQAGLRHGRTQIVDLAGVTYIDSSGIAVLVQGLRAARKRGLEFRLRRPSNQVLAVLRLAQLLQLFTIDDGGAKDG